MGLTGRKFSEGVKAKEQSRAARRATRSTGRDVAATRCPLSLAPGFSRVKRLGETIQPLQRFPAPGKPLKRFASFAPRATSCVPGVASKRRRGGRVFFNAEAQRAQRIAECFPVRFVVGSWFVTLPSASLCVLRASALISGRPLLRSPRWSRESGKPLMRFAFVERPDTRLKPGANEIPKLLEFDHQTFPFTACLNRGDAVGGPPPSRRLTAFDVGEGDSHPRSRFSIQCMFLNCGNDAPPPCVGCVSRRDGGAPTASSRLTSQFNPR